MLASMDSLLELLFNFSFYMVIGSLGAFMKDLYETLTDKNEKIRLGEILIGGTCATFICIFLEDKWLDGAGVKTMFSICFALGILGFEIFGNITSISKLKKFAKVIHEVKNSPPSEWSEDDDKSPPLEQPEYPDYIEESSEESVAEEESKPAKKKRKTEGKEE